MSLLEQLGRVFPPQIQERGDEYFGQRRAQILENRPGYVRAIVRGTGRYRVEIRWNNGDVLNPEYRCGCPYFEDHGECKHVWAVLRQAEAQKLLPAYAPRNGANGNGHGNGHATPARAPHTDPSDPPAGAAPADADAEPEIDPDEDDWELEAEVERQIRQPGARPAPPQVEGTGEDGAPAPPRSRPRWLRTLDAVRDQMLASEQSSGAGAWPAHRRVVYVVDLEATSKEGLLAIELMSEDVLVPGKAERMRPMRLTRLTLPRLPNEDDAQVVQMLIGASRGAGAMDDYLDVDHHYLLPEAAAEPLLRRMIATGRCRVRHREASANLPALHWDDGPAWSFVLRLERDPRDSEILWLRGDFRRRRPIPDAPADDTRRADAPDAATPRDDVLDAAEAAVVLRGGIMIRGDVASRVDDGGAVDLIEALRGEPGVFVPEAQVPQLLGELFAMPRLPAFELPDGFPLAEVRDATPRPRLTIARPAGPAGATAKLIADLAFDYAGTRVPWRPLQPALYDPVAGKLVWRNRDAELASADLLASLGLRPGDAQLGDDAWRLPSARLGRTVATLVARGWLVEAEGKLYRRSGKFNVRVASGIDWLELSGGIDFDGQVATLPELLAAAKAGDKTVRLGDGTFGVLPEDWLQQYGLLAAVGDVEGELVRLSKKQVGLLDALLATVPEATWDESFAKLREELESFRGVQPAEAPAGFTGELRHYQRDGLGWIGFLRKFGFGGCLADDMGLGKTVQVLAMLRQRQLDGVARPSLVVVPRSLIFNWVSEAERFTPTLRVLDHSGAQRSVPRDGFKGYDLVLSTYGTVRRDAAAMKDISFDYVILDEAQAIKNGQSESAKAVRLLKADHKLALSGTPVQNHLGELWSLFEFLNPGLLGAAGAFRALTASAGAPVASGPAGNSPAGTAAGGTADPIGREVLARALRPFILRRTKAQVAPELPDKLEQTLVCELDREQRKLYDELREHYRVSLLQQVDAQGIAKSRMQILEALLRLRQAACHPGLIDKTRADQNSAKLDALLPQLEEVLDEGHKALVFSQFTSFLSILRKKLDARGVPYEYLDGKTTDRQKRVRRFQNDPDCKLFLISLKAGGLGLNLTAAEYVFLLDPWWNPAVEQQAIDRTHRIGQTRQVFAYRLIARDTVEEKVLDLQKAKRDLADAIITADNSMLTSMGREELELLLS